MTAIVGCEHRGKVWMAGDSACTEENDAQDLSCEPKVWVRGGVAFGHAGPLRAGEVLRHILRVPRLPPPIDLERWLHADLIPAMRTALRDDGCLGAGGDDGEEWGSALVGVLGHLYYIDDDFGAYRSRRGYAATGSLSVGSLVGLRLTPRLRPAKRLEAILEAVSEHVASVRPPFAVVCT